MSSVCSLPPSFKSPVPRATLKKDLCSRGQDRTVDTSLTESPNPQMSRGLRPKFSCWRKYPYTTQQVCLARLQPCVRNSCSKAFQVTQPGRDCAIQRTEEQGQRPRAAPNSPHAPVLLLQSYFSAWTRGICLKKGPLPIRMTKPLWASYMKNPSTGSDKTERPMLPFSLSQFHVLLPKVEPP